MEESVLANRCTLIDIGEGSDGIELPTSTDLPGHRLALGGVQVYRRAEADTVTGVQPKLGMLEIRLEDLMGICYTTDRAMRDAVSLGQIIQTAFASSSASGWTTRSCAGPAPARLWACSTPRALAVVAKETSQLAATLVSENVINMRARLRARNRPRSVWYINQELETQLP